MANTPTRLQQLGDPSGQRTSTYWNEWFDAVCTSNEKTVFEWYTSCEEVLRVLRCHMDIRHFVDDDLHGVAPKNKQRFIHPGSGNSLVPFHLANISKLSQHLILDVSDEALSHVQANIMSSSNKEDINSRIKYDVANVLESPLPYESDSFDAWIDKGLLDALFCGSKDGNDAGHKDDLTLCRGMFEEAYRLLETANSDKTKKGGIMLIFTMAERHSLDLILSNWLTYSSSKQEQDSVCSRFEPSNWGRSLHIHEVIPTSGTMRPYCFVLQKDDIGDEHVVDRQEKGTNDWNVVFHPIAHSNDLDNKEANIVRIPFHRDPSVPSSSLTLSPTLLSPAPPSLLSVKSRLDSLLDESRNKFREEMELRDNCLKTSTNNERRMLGTIEIKPVDDTVNLKQLYERITSPKASWGIDSLRWSSIDNDSSCDLSFGNIVPIGFGIHKLVLRCVINSHLLEDLCDAIMEREGSSSCDDGDEGGSIQSIDVDWENSFTVGEVGSVFPSRE